MTEKNNEKLLMDLYTAYCAAFFNEVSEKYDAVKTRSGDAGFKVSMKLPTGTIGYYFNNNWWDYFKIKEVDNFEFDDLVSGEQAVERIKSYINVKDLLEKSEVTDKIDTMIPEEEKEIANNAVVTWSNEPVATNYQTTATTSEDDDISFTDTLSMWDTFGKK